MPPTVAAARKTVSGLLAAIHCSTSAWRDRSSPSRPAVRISQSSLARRRTMALPAIPRWPATQTFLPAREKTSATVAALLHDPKVAFHHVAHQLRKTGLRLPAQHPPSLGRIALQEIHFGRPE